MYVLILIFPPLPALFLLFLCVCVCQCAPSHPRSTVPASRDCVLPIPFASLHPSAHAPAPQRCAGVPATVLVTVLAHLKHLKTLRLKGAPSNSIPELLSALPSLTALDTEYHGPGISKLHSEPLASLRELTVRASSVDLMGPHQLWPWIRRLIPRPSLEVFTLDTFSTLGEMSMPRNFLVGLAQMHGRTMRGFMVDTVKITIEELELLCTQFPRLESLSCSVVTSHTAVSGCGPAGGDGGFGESAS